MDGRKRSVLVAREVDNFKVMPALTDSEVPHRDRGGKEVGMGACRRTHQDFQYVTL